MKNEIKFLTTPFKHEVACYLKENGYDVYLEGKCIKTMASREDIQLLYKFLGKEQEIKN